MFVVSRSAWHEVPNLIEIQKDSYDWFLREGLAEVFEDISPIEDYSDQLLIQEGKVRYIGISNCFAYQLAKANAIARAKGYEEFISIQGHYNLIFREEEREMAKLCKEDNIAMTPYSACLLYTSMMIFFNINTPLLIYKIF